MTRDKVIERIKVMQAWLDGKTIQMRFNKKSGEWSDVSNPQWADHMEYRIKPELRVIWVVFWEDNSAPKALFDTWEAAVNFAKGSVNYNIVRYIESSDD